MRLGIVLGVAAALMGAADAGAATTRYAAPGSAIVSGDCTSSVMRCDLQYALATAASGDTVELEAGTYTEADGYELAKSIIVRGAPGGARPLLRSTQSPDAAIELTQAAASGATLQHLAFAAPASTYAVLAAAVPEVNLRDLVIDTAGPCFSGGVAVAEDVSCTTTQPNTLAMLVVGGAAQVRRLSVTAPGTTSLSISAVSSEDVTIAAGGVLLQNGTHRRWRVNAGGSGTALTTTGLVTLTDALIRADGPAVSVASNTLTLRNVTTVGSSGVIAQGGEGGSTASLTNVIARGTGAADDLVATDGGLCIPGPCVAGAIDAKFTNARTAASARITYGAGVQSGDPLLVSATDLHLQEASPARNAGDAIDVDSITDVDGDPRFGQGQIDIGGDEFVPLAPVATATPEPSPTATPGPAPATTPTATPAPDRTAPILTRVRDGKKGRIAFVSSEAGTARATVARRTTGRRRGRRCVKATPKLRRARTCVRYVTVGTVTLFVRQGVNLATPKPRRRGLPRGTYRVRLVPRDAAGNVGRTTTVTIVKR